MRPGLLALCVPALLGQSRLNAQVWTVDAYAGRARFDAVGASVGARNAALALRYQGARHVWLYGSVAAPFGGEDPAWAAAGVGNRFDAGSRSIRIGIDLSGQTHVFRDPQLALIGRAATLLAMPVASLRSGIVQAEIRGGVRHHVSVFDGASLDRTLRQSDANVSLRPVPALLLSAEGRYAHSSEGAYPYAGTAAALLTGPFQLEVYAGRWFDDALPGTAWGVGASVEAGANFQFWAVVRREGVDPLYWNAPRQSWSLGVSRRLGRPRSVGALATSPYVVSSAGRVTFTIPLSEADNAPAVGGDFNQWVPVIMARSGSVWTVTVAVPRGTWHFAFRSADGTWFVPDSIPGRISDGFGGESAIFVVT